MTLKVRPASAAGGAGSDVAGIGHAGGASAAREVNVLEALGLGNSEESAYLELVRHGPASVPELADRTGLPASTVRRAVTGLHRKGLVRRTPPPRDLVVAVPPDIAVDDLIQHRRDELERVREAAQRLFAETHERVQNRSTEQLIEIVPAARVLGAFEQIQRTAQTEVRILVAPPYLTPSEISQLQFERAAAGVAYRSVYGHEALGRPGFMAAITMYIHAGEQARLTHTVPMKLAIADRVLALVPLDWTSPNSDAVLVRPCGLLDALLALFESIWALASPLMVSGSGELANLGEISAEDNELLSLLVAGFTDEAAGARLGMSRRTVVRRVQHLMKVTGARSRLQLGWRARERGWL
jgi:predicted transcriptional regulator